MKFIMWGGFWVCVIAGIYAFLKYEVNAPDASAKHVTQKLTDSDPDIEVVHDEYHEVTCYVYRGHGISCLQDLDVSHAQGDE